MRTSIARIRAELEGAFKERSDEIICSLLALCAGEHVLFIGPPGTAKSQLARRVCEIIDGSFFYYLMTRFTTPEEVFGPLSLKALQEDDFSRRIDGYLPTAHVAFLDEIFKSSSAILNSFLTVLNERKFHNGRETIDVPLIAAFGASNRLPEEDDHLEALYDRFLLRCVVSPIREEDNFREMLFEAAAANGRPARLSVGQIRALQARAGAVGIDERVQRIVLQARKELGQRNIFVSDRRWKKIVGTLQIAAAAADRDLVDRSMVILLKHMAWDRPEQREGVRSLLIDLIIAGGENLEKLAGDITDLHGVLARATDRPLPYPVRCYDCGEQFDSSKKLAIHQMENPRHQFFDPHRSSLHLRYMNYPRLVAVLEEEYGWDSVFCATPKKRELRMEYQALKDRFDATAENMVNEMGRLTRQLTDNVWVSHLDGADILNRYEAQLHRFDQIAEVMRSIEVMLSAEAFDECVREGADEAGRAA